MGINGKRLLGGDEWYNRIYPGLKPLESTGSIGGPDDRNRRA